MLEAETGLALSLLSAAASGRDLASKLECKEAEALKSLNWSRSKKKRIQTSKCQTLDKCFCRGLLQLRITLDSCAQERMLNDRVYLFKTRCC